MPRQKGHQRDFHDYSNIFWRDGYEEFSSGAGEISGMSFGAHVRTPVAVINPGEQGIEWHEPPNEVPLCKITESKRRLGFDALGGHGNPEAVRE